MSDDYTQDTSTTGSVAVGGVAAGEIGSSGDRDWFAVDLVAGHTYVIDLRGRPTDDGTLSDPYLRGLHDADGNLISGTTNDDGGEGRNSRLTFTASESGTYFIAAGAYSSRQGTYELEVTESVSDDTQDGAKDLGDITGLDGPRFPNASLDGDGDGIDYFRFTLTEAKEVGLGLRQQDADADLFLEDAEGNVLYSSTEDGTANEAINETLLAGTYYVRVEAQEEGNNDFRLRYGVSAPDPDEVARLEQREQGGADEAPGFAQQSYTFSLAENADGSTNRVALGTVTATDPEAATVTYSIEGGNTAGLFEIDAATGALSYKGTGEDYESGTTGYELTVRASDGTQHSDVTVNVNVTDVQEAPAFGQQSYAFDLAENADGSTNRVALGTVSATDPEAAALAYSIEGGNAAGLFEIDASTGALSYKGTGEDYEAGTTGYELTVRANDGSLHRDVTVTVNITDVEEPVVPPPIVDYRDSATDLGDITDLAGPRFPAASLDGDDDRIDYFRLTLTAAKEVGLGLRQQDADADLFLEDAEGNVLHSSTEDGTANEWISQTLLAGTYYVRVESQEQGNNDLRLRYGVSAPDQDEVARLEQQQQGGTNEAPAFGRQSYAFDLAENADGSTNRVALGTLSATDREDATLTYSIEDGNAAGLFEIDASTGALSYKGAGEDYESGTTSYELTVRASDGSLHSDVTVTVNVTDAAEAPAFGQQSYAFDLAENADGSTNRVALGTVTATDPEAAALTYSIEGGNATGLFEIDASTGALSYKGAGEDYESGTTSYELTVRASDDGLHSDVNVTVNITDVEEQTEPDPLISQLQQAVVQETVSEPDGEDFSADSSSQGRVAVGSTATGEIGAWWGDRNWFAVDLVAEGDRDWFAVDLVAGRTYVIDLRGRPTGDGTLSDPYLRGIHDADGNLISGTTNDDGGTGYNSQLTFTASESDTYFIAAGAYGIFSQGTYELEVTDTAAADDFPQDTSTTGRVAVGGSATGDIQSANDQDWFAVELVAGQTYQIDVRGRSTGDGWLPDPYLHGIHDAEGNLIAGTTNDDGGEGNNSRLTFTATENGTYYIAAGANSGQGTYVVEVAEDDFAQSTETTGTVEVGGTTSGEIQRADDRDWFAVELEADKAYQIDLSGVRSGGGTLNLPHLRGVYDSESNQIPGVYSPLAFAFQNSHNRLIEGSASVDIQVFRGEDSRAFFTPDEDGTYYLELGNFDFSSTGTYTVGVTEIEDDFLRTVDTTGTVEIGSSVTGEIQYPNDRDWFAVELSAGVTYKVELLGEDDNGGTLQLPYIRGIRDADGRQVSDTTYYATDPYPNSQSEYQTYPHSNSELIFSPDADGTYYVAAGSYMTGSREDDAGTYTLKVSIDDTRVDPTSTSEPASGDLAADTSTIGRLAVGGSAFGEIGNAADRDWFAVELEAGETYRINTDGRQSGGGTLPRGRLFNIYDADGNEIPGVDDQPITWVPIHYPSPRQVRNMDGLAFFTPDQDGTYYLEVGSGSFDTGLSVTTGTGSYTVRVAEMEDDFSASTDTTGTVEVGGTATGESQYEIDRDWFAVELTAGETYKVELLGARAKGGTLPQPYIWGIHDANGDLISDTSDYASGPHSNSQVFFTPNEDGTYYVAAGNHESGALASDVGTYTLQVSIDDFTDDIHTTGTLEVGGSVTGEIEAQGDRDWFAVTLEAGTTYQIDMEGSATDGGTLDNPTLYSLRDANGSILQFVGFDRDSGEGLNARATFTVDEDGTYYVVALSGGHMHADDSHGRSIGTYTLSVDELVPAVVEPVDAI